MAKSAQSTHNQQSTMQIAQVLSDLVSLRVCDPNAALALVSERALPSGALDQGPLGKDDDDDDDVDLKRAKELVGLHYGVREAHKRGELGAGLDEARRAVERAVGA